MLGCLGAPSFNEWIFFWFICLWNPYSIVPTTVAKAGLSISPVSPPGGVLTANEWVMHSSAPRPATSSRAGPGRLM